MHWRAQEWCCRARAIGRGGAVLEEEEEARADGSYDPGAQARSVGVME